MSRIEEIKKEIEELQETPAEIDNSPAHEVSEDVKNAIIARLNKGEQISIISSDLKVSAPTVFFIKKGMR